jgi:hypothetical protein
MLKELCATLPALTRDIVALFDAGSVSETSTTTARKGQPLSIDSMTISFNDRLPIGELCYWLMNSRWPESARCDEQFEPDVAVSLFTLFMKLAFTQHHSVELYACLSSG